MGAAAQIPVGTILSNAARAASCHFSHNAQNDDSAEQNASKTGSYGRRADEWILQYNLAWQEARRLQVWRLKQRGWPQRQSAAALGVSEGAVRQWMKRARHGGADALRHRPPPGAPARLTHTPLARVPALLQQGTEAYGFRGELWTRGRMATVIRLECGVSYHPAHISRVCQAMRWSPQKPARRARQRDKAAITHWRDETWPALQKGRKRSNKRSSS